MSFLTVEDVNTVNLNHVNEFHEIDTGKISLQEFDNVLYDFCKVSHSKTQNNYHIFEITVNNKLWTGGYSIRRPGGWISAGDVSFNSSTNTITVSTEFSSIQLYLVMCDYVSEFLFERMDACPVEAVQYLKLNEVGESKRLFWWDALHQKTYFDRTLSLGLNTFTRNGVHFYLFCCLKKTDLDYDLTETILQVGNINHVRLNVGADYLPDGDLTDDQELDIVVKYGAQEIPCEYDETEEDYCFDLDLTKKIDNKPVRLEVTVYESKYVNGGVFNHNVNCQYVAADSFSSLQSLITLGNEIIELSSDITFTSNLSLPQNLYLIGNDHQIFMGNYSVVLENVSCKCEKVSFNDGAPIFIQGADSKLNVVGCVFNNANISDEYKGSVLSTLNKSNIASTFSDCSILNCHHSIWHCGTLIIDNCKALFNDFNISVDADYSAFLTAHDCQIEITNSIFDIDYTDLCSDEIDIKYAETLICLGENTILNGVTVDKLTADNTLPICTSQYNNKSHIYCKYYYPAIEECVIASPLPNFEDKAVCHTIMGQDWIYKNNVQITKASTGNENNNRKIIWEE